MICVKLNILVTGGSGFIGSHLCKALLEKGHYVINIDNFDDFYNYQIKIKNTLYSLSSEEILFDKEDDKSSALKKLSSGIEGFKNYSLYICDICDSKAVEKIFKVRSIEVIIHLAALAGVRPSIDRPLEYEKVNVRGTTKLLEFSKKYGIKKFICASSSSVYGNNKKFPFSEDDSVDQTVSPYAATKKSCELIAHVYHHLYAIDMIILRFFTVYGPGQRPDLAIHKFTILMSFGEKIPFFGNGSTSRDYTYIDDITEGILNSLDYVTQRTGVYEILNLGNHQNVSLKEMVKTLESALSIKANLQLFPLPAGDVEKTCADISKAKKMIKYFPKTGFREGIDNFVEWFKKRS
ncbi:GDP-mannose 4,6-dehydratase [Bacteroidetes bacterium endosymbiont of Geopemphigus sp.]|uniref:GDP-mannose 4,6-dehydratase n=1 Tax=Bacteroidetes bacterium endosymbiont of Geopemphigus sp. TaxID=2047937 RepID=UPI000CD0D690|nr:GDP-mannose 4,6-dehydratase [Bacteroidetes bacterium endosymbiont of Geopemphigus sp.]